MMMYAQCLHGSSATDAIQLMVLCASHLERISLPDRILLAQYTDLYRRGIRKVHEQTETTMTYYDRSKTYFLVLEVSMVRISFKSDFSHTAHRS